jgi:phage major head subunit gpT-like protein
MATVKVPLYVKVRGKEEYRRRTEAELAAAAERQIKRKGERARTIVPANYYLPPALRDIGKRDNAEREKLAAERAERAESKRKRQRIIDGLLKFK